MTETTTGFVGLGALFLLMGIRVPIGLAMLLVGFLGSASILGLNGILNMLNTAPYEEFSSYSFSIIPLFLLMGQFASNAGLSTALYNAAGSWLGHRRGGLAASTIGACAGFGAVCGSSLATAATMAQVALPEMRKAGYDRGFATGTLAAGGTLGILIPPSVVLVIYAVLTSQNIAKLFAAALLPGLLAVFTYIVAASLYARRYPEAAPLAPRASRHQRLRSIIDVWPVVLIFVVVIGGIYAGIFTPTEAAAVGAIATGALALARKGLGWKEFKHSVYNTATGTGMIFFIILGAAVFNGFLALTQLPQDGAAWIVQLSVSPWLILVVILLCYLILGCFMDTLSMILLTIPIFFPIVTALDFGLPPDEVALWFGILALMVVEVGMITPPLGLNLFVINSMARDVPMIETIRGVFPFLAADLVRISILITFPGISLFLVRLFY
ncbi:MAG: TRAP transporter large permease [Aquisalimonadaceae bacterium]